MIFEGNSICIFAVLVLLSPAQCQELSGFEDGTEHLHDNLVQVIDAPETLILDDDVKVPVNDPNLAGHPYALMIFTHEQINKIIQHRNKFGNILCIEELQRISGIDNRLLLQIEDKLTYNSGKKDSNNYFNTNNAQTNLLYRHRHILEKARAYQMDSTYRYAGNRLYSLFRFRYFSKGRWDINFTLEKDPGESYFTHKKSVPLPDHLSLGFLLVKPTSYLTRLIIGDYRLSLGQGLIYGSGFGSLASGSTAGLIHSRPWFGRNNSLDETRFLRGTAMEFTLVEGLSAGVFLSRKRIDASMDTLDVETGESRIFLQSIRRSGYHRSSNELKHRHNAEVSDFGLGLRSRIGQSDFNLNIISKIYNYPLILGGQITGAPEQGPTHFRTISADFKSSHQNINFFGEIAFQSWNQRAIQLGILIVPDPSMDLVIVYRDYSAGFHAPDSSSLGNGGLSNNQRGIYFKSDIYFNQNWRIENFADISKSNPAIDGYRIQPMLAYGLKLAFRKRKQTELYVLFRYRSFPGPYILRKRGSIQTNKYNFRIHYSHHIGQGLEWRSRIEFVRIYSMAGSNRGRIFYQDIIFKPLGYPMSFSSRLAVFNTDAYASRIYVYENSLTQMFSLPSYYGKGVRYYINVRIKSQKGLSFEFGLARTIYHDRNTISSGPGLIDGTHKTEFRSQIRMSF